MSDTTVTCPTCGAENQQVGKYCEQCGTVVSAPGAPGPAAPAPADLQTAGLSPTPPPPDPATQPPAGGDARFVLVSGGVLDPTRSFTVPRGSRALVGRTDLSSDPSRRTVPEVDVTAWARRVQTSDGMLYTVHRRQCYISVDAEGVVRIVDYPDYVGDTLVSPAGGPDFKTIPALGQERPPAPDGAVELRPGDRILMGQGEGTLVFQLVAA